MNNSLKEVEIHHHAEAKSLTLCFSGARCLKAFFYAFRAPFFGTVPAFPASVSHSLLASVRGTGYEAAPVMLPSVPATGADAASAFPGGVLANCLGAGLPYPAGAPRAGSGVVLKPLGDFRAP